MAHHHQQQQGSVELFNVVQFFYDGTNEIVCEERPVVEAVDTFSLYATSVGAKIGTTIRVIIVDKDDMTVADWQYGKGVVFPPLFPPR